MRLINYLLKMLIKFYKYFISSFFSPSCRYLPTCSEYFLDCLNIHGPLSGSILGIKRILRCHPIKILGGKNGFDPAPKLKKDKK